MSVTCRAALSPFIGARDIRLALRLEEGRRLNRMADLHGEPEADSLGDEGVMYVAFGRLHLVMAVHSAASFRRTNPTRGITIVTNVEIPPSEAIIGFDPTRDAFVLVADSTEANRDFKTSAGLHSRYGRTLLLDADTVVLKSLDEPFSLLGYVDVLLKPDPKGQNRVWQQEEIILDVARMGDVPAWNGGVMFFRRRAVVEQLFLTWSERYRAKGSPFDQPSLLEATLLSSARVFPLDERWNCPTGRFEKSGGFEGPTRILHYMRSAPSWVIDGLVTVDDRLMRAGVLSRSSELRDELVVRQRPTSTHRPPRRGSSLRGIASLLAGSAVHRGRGLKIPPESRREP